MPNIPKDDGSKNLVPITSDMRPAKAIELTLGRKFYWRCQGNKKMASVHIVRPRIKKQFYYGKDETEEEYEEYKDFLLTIVRRGECLIKKES